jgi:hexosaminidase
LIFLAAALAALHLLPRPQSIALQPCGHPFAFAQPLRVSPSFDPGAFDLVNERWRALGIPALLRSNAPNVVVRHTALSAQSYRLTTSPSGVQIEAGDPAGAFYAAMTLAQLPQRSGSHWVLPCARIADAPALRWRVLSDDVSRGPLPNMQYFKERIRTIAAFKMNGYSPYMEHVFVDPHDPLPAPLDGITPAQLRELDTYAARYHVAFIPEQQTFAHMHNTLRLERYASAAELPHAFLLSPNSPLSLQYITHVVRDELAIVKDPPFFHIGSDETSTLGQGQTAAVVQQRGLTQVYADHINAMAAIVHSSGARLMLWDDGIEKDPRIMRLIPHSAVIVNWHYGNEKTFMPYINLLAKGGFDQMVAPGDSNWNQIYPDIAAALQNEDTFVTEGKRAHVLGLFQTVWHDDGASLFEATWYPVLYAAASGWEQGSVDRARFLADFPWAFFGSDDKGYSNDIGDLADVQSKLADSYDFTSNYLLFVDPFDPRAAAHMQQVDVRAARLKAEDAEQHLLLHTPPLHANAARVMFLAAREYDFIGRKFQAAQEARDYYADAQAHAHKPQSPSGRDLTWVKYWFWELRDSYEELAPLYAAAWRYEDRESHLQSNLERYHVAAQRNIDRADRVYAASLDYYAGKALPPLDEVLGLPHD